MLCASKRYLVDRGRKLQLAVMSVAIDGRVGFPPGAIGEPRQKEEEHQNQRCPDRRPSLDNEHCRVDHSDEGEEGDKPAEHFQPLAGSQWMCTCHERLALALQTTGGETRHNSALEDKHHDYQRDGNQRTCGHNRGVGRGVGIVAGKARDRHGDRFGTAVG